MNVLVQCFLEKSSGNLKLIKQIMEILHTVLRRSNSKRSLNYSPNYILMQLYYRVHFKKQVVPSSDFIVVGLCS